MARAKPAPALVSVAPAPEDAVGDPTLALCQEVAARLAALTAGEAGAMTTPLDAVGTGRLADLAERFALGPVAAGLVAVAATAALDGRFGALFAGLDAGRGRTRPRVEVALTLAGGSLFDAAHRELLGPASVLRRAGLLEVHDEHEPLPDRVLAVPERVVGHLLGSDAADPALLAMFSPAAGVEHPAVLDVTRALVSGHWLVWLRDHGGSGRSAAATALGVAGTPAVVLDLDRLPTGQTLGDILPAATREAGLVGGAVVVGPIDLRRDREALRELAGPPIRPLILVSPGSWDPAISVATPVLVDAPRLDPLVRRPIWDEVLADLAVADADALAAELALLRVAPDQAVAVGATAAGLAAAAGEDVDGRHLRAAALAQGAGRLDALSQHVVPAVTFDDLVLPEAVMAELRAVPGRYRTRHIVHEQWGLDPRHRRGITCLFAGASGTGKTLAAEVIAHELGVDLFVIDLSQIVDKYIGETEKNLERVFDEAEGVNGVLLFDEADALFGKRSAVSSAHDRHANVEVAYLLQRMERYEGIAVLTTNLRNNIDDAFTRRLDVICSFPEPGPEERLALWQRHLPPSVPQDADVDLRWLADALAVAGGTIRNIAVTAAHTAAIANTVVTQAMLVAAARREYLKLGRMYAEVRPERGELVSPTMSVRTRKPPATKVERVPDPPVRRSTVRVGAVDDPAEAAADRLAAQAMALSSSYDTVRRAPDGSLAAGFDLDETALRRASSSPQRLDDATRDRMEQGFGRDLGEVRVHTDGAAADLATDIGARAFTHGQDVYFGAGEYQPGSAEGDHVLAHELAHTVQAGENVHRYPASWVNTPVTWGQQTARVVRPGGGVSGGVYIMHSRPNAGPVTTAVAKPTFGKNAAGDVESGAQIVAADRLMREFGLTAPTSRVVKKGSPEYADLLALCQPYAPQQPAQGQPGRDNWQPLDEAQDFVVMSEIVNARTLQQIAQGAGAGGNDAKNDLLQVLNDPQLMHDLGLMMVADMVVGNSDRFLSDAKNLGNVMVSVLNGQRTLNVFDTTAFLPRVAGAEKFLGANPMIKGGVNLKFNTQNPGTVYDEMLGAVVQVVKGAQPQAAQGGQAANGPTFAERLEAALAQQRPRLFASFMLGWNAGVAKALQLSQGDNAQTALGDLAGEENVQTEGLKAVATYVANADDQQNKAAAAKAAAVVAARAVSEIDLQSMAPDGGIVDPVNWVKVPSKVRKAEWVDNPRLPTPADVSNVQPATNGDFDEPAYRRMKNNLLRARSGVQDSLGDKKRMFKSQPRNRAELGRAVVTAEAMATGTFWLSACSHNVRRAATRLAELTPVIPHLSPGDAAAIAGKATQVEQFIEPVATAQAPYDKALTDAIATIPRTAYPDAAHLVTTLNHAEAHSAVVTRKLNEARGKELYKLINAMRVRANTRTA